jgi:hypothetical protein
MDAVLLQIARRIARNGLEYQRTDKRLLSTRSGKWSRSGEQAASVRSVSVHREGAVAGTETIRAQRDKQKCD